MFEEAGWAIVGTWLVGLKVPTEALVVLRINRCKHKVCESFHRHLVGMV